MRNLWLLAVIGAATMIAGCGVYSFSSSSKPPFESINGVPFENETLEGQSVVDPLTNAVINAFILDNTVKIRDASQAEAIMTGTLRSYHRDPYTYDKEDIVTKYAVKISLHVKVVKAKTEDVIWEDDFFAEGAYDAVSETEETGQEKAIALLTEDILNKVTKSW